MTEAVKTKPLTMEPFRPYLEEIEQLKAEDRWTREELDRIAQEFKRILAEHGITGPHRVYELLFRHAEPTWLNQKIPA